MNLFFRLYLSIVLLFSLAGCTAKNMHQTQELAQCKMICIQHVEFCKRNCVDNCPFCTWHAEQKSKIAFAKYVHERQIQDKKVMRELHSYRDPLQCRKVSCNCMLDLATCKQSCSNVVLKKLHTMPNC